MLKKKHKWKNFSEVSAPLWTKNVYVTYLFTQAEERELKELQTGHKTVTQI